MISLELWGRRPIAAANAASLLGGMIMVGLTTFLPVYVQGVMGQSALAAGFALSAMVMGWPIGATISPRLWKRVGPQPVLRAGAAMVPLGALATAYPWIGELGIHGIGAAPAVIALFLYSLLPVVANTSLGLGRVPPSIVEAARGMGLTDWQLLRQVEFALALPVILTGIRIVVVQNIGLVTIAALIGGER